MSQRAYNNKLITRKIHRKVSKRYRKFLDFPAREERNSLTEDEKKKVHCHQTFTVTALVHHYLDEVTEKGNDALPSNKLTRTQRTLTRSTSPS